MAQRIRLPIAYEGRRFIAIGGICTVIAGVVSLPAGFLLLLLTLFILSFFRDPERISLESPAAVLSPADGKIIDIVSEPDQLLKGYASRVSIFMNLLNVHVNRSPIDGKVMSVEHLPGMFHAADSKDADRNEHVDIEIDSGVFRVNVRLIAGLVARRIVPYIHPDQKLERGERIGIIMFGSRVDLSLPADMRLEVKPGDRVRAGITRIATIVPADGQSS